MRVGLYSLMPTQWKTMRQVARLLRDSGRYVPVVFFDRNAGNRPYERDVRACLADGIECHDAEGAITEGRVTDVVARDPRPRSIAIRALHAAFGRSPRLWDGLIEPLVAFPEQYTHYRERIAFATRWLEEQRIDLLVAPGDSTSYDTPAWIEAGHRLRVSTVIVPFSTNTPAGVAADLSRFPEHDATRWFNRIVGVVAPHWIYQNLVRESAGKIFALSALGLAPPRPWILHSGNADRILVDTEHTRAEFVDSGLAADRITVTGALSDDTLALSHADA
ncbi:MAG TPA: hypothetical protein VF403_24750, partial [Kofleriaceae bacterium]